MARDSYELVTYAQSQFFFFPSAEYDLHVTISHERPRIFTLIDGNNLRATKKLLSTNPEQAHTRLPDSSGGWYPLHLAAVLGRTAIVKLLLSEPYKADPNVRSSLSNITPLHQAVFSKHPDAVELLLEAGAQVDAKYYIPDAKYLRDLTALELSMENVSGGGGVTPELKRIVTLLLRHGADYLRNSGGRG